MQTQREGFASRHCQGKKVSQTGITYEYCSLRPCTAAQAIGCRSHRGENGLFLKIHQFATCKTNKKSLFTMAKLQIYFTEHINKAILKHGLLKHGPTAFVSSNRCSTLNQKSRMYSKMQRYQQILHQQFFCASLSYFPDGIFLGLVLLSVIEKHQNSNNMTETFLFHCRVTHWNYMPSTCLWTGSSKDTLHSFDIR